MLITHRLDEARGLVHTTVSGAVSVSDIRCHVLTVRRGQAHDYCELVDARRADGVQLTSKDMLTLANLARETLGQSPIAPRAVIVGSDQAFTLARIFSALVAGWVRVGVFEDLETAQRWLLG